MGETSDAYIVFRVMHESITDMELTVGILSAHVTVNYTRPIPLRS